MEVKATLSNLKVSPRKARLVIDLIRGKNISQAEEILRFTDKKAAEPILKLLKSAVANAEHNFHYSKDNLFIKSIGATDGMTLKRYTPRAHGRATMIRKRWSHVKLALSEIKPTTLKTTGEKKSDKKSALKPETIKTVTDVQEVKKITGQQQASKQTDSEDSKSSGSSKGSKKQFTRQKTGE